MKTVSCKFSNFNQSYEIPIIIIKNGIFHTKLFSSSDYVLDVEEGEEVVFQTDFESNYYNITLPVFLPKQNRVVHKIKYNGEEDNLVISGHELVFENDLLLPTSGKLPIYINESCESYESDESDESEGFSN